MANAPAQVSIHQAAATALQVWISSQLADHNVADSWPEPSAALPARTITVIQAGAPKTTWLDDYAVSFTPPVAPATFGTWIVRLGQIEAPFQLDCWDTSNILRDDTVTRMRFVLHANKNLTLGPSFITSTGLALSTYSQPIFEPQLALQLAPPYQAIIAGYLFDDPEIENSSTASQQKEYRATFRGTAAYDYIIAVPATMGIAQLSTVIMKAYVTETGTTNPPAGTLQHILTVTNASLKQSDGT